MTYRTAARDWCTSQPACKGNLGLTRAEMPQIEGDQVLGFVSWLEGKGVPSILGIVPVGSLQASQGEINAEKVERMRGQDIGGPPILVSKDGYVLDGHHRWAALLVEDPQKMIRVIRIGLPIRVLVEVAHEFPKSHRKDIEDRVAANQLNALARRVAWRWMCQ